MLLASKTDGINLGRIKNSPFKKEMLTEAELGHHIHIVGASGFGKTVLISHIIKQQIERNKGLAFIDLKGDIEIIKRFSKYAEECGRLDDVKIFSLSDQNISSKYNLIADGTPTQLRDKIMQSFNWSEEYYKNQSASFLLRLLIGLCHLRDLQKLNLHLGIILEATRSPEYIEDLIHQISDLHKEPKYSLQSCLSFLNEKENFQSLQGLRTQLESLIFADFGKLIASNDPGINLFEAVQNNKIIFIFLDSRRYGETAKSVGRFILQDLKMVSAKIDAEIPDYERKPFTVIIDEFADLAQEDFIAFLDRARSSKMSIVVAHQELNDLKRISPEFAARLTGNTSTLYAFLQKNSESAEMISGMAGTRTVWKTTMQTERVWFFEMESGRGSKREVEEFLIHPNLIKNLPVGRCVCVKKYPCARAYWLDVNSLVFGRRKLKPKSIVGMTFGFAWASLKWVTISYFRIMIWFLVAFFSMLKGAAK